MSYSHMQFDVNGRWETNFPVSSDGPFPHSTWTEYIQGVHAIGGTVDGHGTEVLEDAKRPGSPGACGARFWKGSGDDNRLSHRLRFIFKDFYGGGGTRRPEVWVRYYFRYEEGFSWASYSSGDLNSKEIYWDEVTDSEGCDAYTSFYGGNIMRTVNQGGGAALGEYNYPSGNPGWDSIYPGGTSDGSWHCLEAYMKMEDTGQENGIGRIWLNGELVAEHHGVRWRASDATYEGWWHFAVIHNHKDPQLERAYYVDVDDVVVYVQEPPNTDEYGNPYIGLDDGEEGGGEEPGGPEPGEPTGPDFEGTLIASDEGWSDNWYDANSGPVTDGVVHWHWSQGNTIPDGTGSSRKHMDKSATELMAQYDVYLSPEWIGSGQNFHPHILHLLSTDDGDWFAPANSEHGLYFEFISDTSSPYNTYPLFSMQDSLRINTDHGDPPIDLVGITEDRSAANCNTPAELNGMFGTCYQGNNWYSASSVSADIGIPKDQWVRLSYYVKMNTVTEGVGNWDGVLKMWVNDSLAYENNEVLFAAGAYSNTSWDKIFLGPWMGEGSPIDQEMWIRNLNVYEVTSENGGEEPSPPGLGRVVLGGPGRVSLGGTGRMKI